MMNELNQWYELRSRLRKRVFSLNGIENQFYAGLLRVLSDTSSQAGDRLAAYRDALMATLIVSEKASLPAVDLAEITPQEFASWGLSLSYGSGDVSLATDNAMEFAVSDGLLDTHEVYRLTQRRDIKVYPMDPALKKALRSERYTHFHGAGQRDAVRVVLNDEQGSTFIINLPTGVGKTLIVEALDAFSPTQGLTVVIVPTIGLAIDQGRRMEDHLREIGIDHGGGYCWHSGLNNQERSDIFARIRSGKQRIVFCSPESALTSLRWPIIEVARSGRLRNIVIDEAHLVDHWGAEFRPDFQGLAALIKTARLVAAEINKKIRCILLSATYGPKTVNVLQSLFAPYDQAVAGVHGSFLRPEIQYAVREVPEEKHLEVVLQAIRMLPKPMIVYLTKKQDADLVYRAIVQTLGLSRVSKFTGDTEASERELILDKWVDGAIDIVIATSAFGVGINKLDVRSVLHAAVPENIDRFYQEVGRGGRDGCASQSLLIFHKAQLPVAKGINTQKLISPELGLERWTQLWGQGKSAHGGKREIDMGVIPNRLQWRGDENKKWNWRTLMLMKRAGVIDIEMATTKWTQIFSKPIGEENAASSEAHDDKETVRLLVTTIEDDHQSEKFWQSKVEPQRTYEIQEQKKGYKALRKWLLNPNHEALCQLLAEYYTTEGMQPERVCSGCPACRKQGVTTNLVPSVGSVSHLRGIRQPVGWPTQGFPDHAQVSAYYDSLGGDRGGKFVDEWIGWIGRLIENRMIDAIRSTEPVLNRIEKKLPRGLKRYWIALSLEQRSFDESVWRELVLVPPGYTQIPRFGLSDIPRIFLAPKSIISPRHPSRLWWQDNSSAIHLDTLVERLNYVTYQ